MCHCDGRNNENNMYRGNTALAGLLMCLCGVVGAQELAPPDATFFVEVQGTRSDFGAFDLEDKTGGTRLRGGMWLNEQRFGRWKLGVEGAFFRMGESVVDSESVRPATAQEQLQQPTLESVRTVSRDRVEISGFEMGLRLYDDELFFVRAGGYLYSYREEHDEFQERRFTTSAPTTNDPAPETETASSMGPYAGLGVRFPLGEKIKLVTEANHYIVEGEGINSFGLGIRYQSR